MGYRGYGFAINAKGKVKCHRRKVNERVEFKQDGEIICPVNTETRIASRNVMEYQRENYLTLNSIHSENKSEIPILPDMDYG